MGGGVGSKLARPFRNWNVENRAHKIISQEKPRAAPTYQSTQKQIDLVNKLEPDYTEKAQKKDQKLDDYLKKVYVTSNSTEVQEIDQRSDPDRPLPKDKLLHEGFEYGVYEPREIPPGRISLRQALEFLSNHKNDPEKYTAEFIAVQYKLDKEVVENILEHFNLFLVYNTTKDHNQDVVMTHVPISHRTGVTVRFSEDKDDIHLTQEEYDQKFLEATSKPRPIDEPKKNNS